jgi:hypothetical protein
LLTATEGAEAAADVRELILAAGQEAVVLRRVSGEGLYGADDADFTEIGVVPIEIVTTPAEDLAKSIDATASVLPEADVRLEDRVRVGPLEYRVQTVVEERLFGVTTHLALELVRLHGG